MSHDEVRVHYIYHADGSLDRIVDNRNLDAVKAWWIKRLELLAQTKIEDEWSLEQQRYAAIGALSDEDQEACSSYIAATLAELESAKKEIASVVATDDSRDAVSLACDKVQKVGLSWVWHYERRCRLSAAAQHIRQTMPATASNLKPVL